MLDDKLRNKIIEFVSLQPRCIDEIAKYIGKNWRTANRYVDTLAKEGFLMTKVFRSGSRGALKIAYINHYPTSYNIFQSELYEHIKNGRVKTDFSPFDIWQYVDKSKKRAFIEYQEDESKLALNKDLINILKSAKKDIFIFSGNLSWSRIEIGHYNMLNLFEQLVKRDVNIYVLCRVDITSKQNVEKFLVINKNLKKESIKIRHREQPLRAVIIDDSFVRFKEIKDPKDYKKGELDKKAYIFYDIYDRDWIIWLKKVFWNMFNTSIDAVHRLKELNQIRQLKINYE